MYALVKFFISLFFLLNTTVSSADPQPVASYSQSGKQITLTVDLFLSTTCPHCHKADDFFRNLEISEPWLVIHRYYINQDKLALQDLYKRLQQQDLQDFSVPAMFFCDSRWVGFADAQSSGRTLLRALKYCRQQISQQGKLSQGTINALRQQSKVSQVHVGANVSKSAPKFILLSALGDSISACSLFFIMALFAFLWLYPGQKLLQLGVGISFLVPLALIHYLLQTYPGYSYQISTLLRLPSVFVGIMLVFYTVVYFRKRESGVVIIHPGFVYGLIMLTATVIYVYQQTCGVNVGLVFQQWLADQAASSSQQLLYQAAYHVVYLLPLFSLLFIYILSSRHHRLARYDRRLKIAAYLILLVTGCLLIFYPQLFSNIAFSFILLVAAVAFGSFYTRRYES